MATIRNKFHLNFRTPRHLIIVCVACRRSKNKKATSANVNSISDRRSGFAREDRDDDDDDDGERDVVSQLTTSLSYLAARICNLRFAHRTRVRA